MRLETVVIIVKGWAITTSTLASTLAAGLLSQIKDVPNVFGVSTVLIAILLNAYSASMAALIGFVSSSFGDFMAKRGNSPSGNTTQFVLQPPPGAVKGAPTTETKSPIT